MYGMGLRIYSRRRSDLALRGRRRSGTSSRRLRLLAHYRNFPLNRRHQPVTLAENGLQNSRVLRVILQGHANLADGRIDSLPGIHKHIVSPKPLDNFFAGNQLAFLLGEENEEFHGNFFQLHRLALPPQFIAPKVELELGEFDHFGLHGPLTPMSPEELKYTAGTVWAVAINSVNAGFQ